MVIPHYHTNKSLLLVEIEPRLDLTQWHQGSTVATHVVVDFMSKMRQIPLGHFPKRVVALDTIITSASSLWQNVKFAHLVLDSYIKMSLKEGERMRRTGSTSGISIIGMNRYTPIPHQLDKFWASQENMRNLQLLVRDIVRSRVRDNVTIIASSLVSDDEALPATTAGGEEIPDLLNRIEEADTRLVPPVDWAVRVQRCKRVVVVSNDTYTFALLLHYTPYLQDLGLKEFWQQYGTGEKRRMLPLHQAVCQLGPSLAKTVIKAHILTGDDCMSKVGTKHAAMSCDPVQYLKMFWETDKLLEQDAELAEKYLVRVWAGARSNTTCETFNQLRAENYITSTVGIDALPPTSSEITDHIERGAFLVHRACQLLAIANERESRLQPLQHGWEEHFDALIPSKSMNSLPRSHSTICKCAGMCDTRRRRCHSSGISCVIFCHGKKGNVSCNIIQHRPASTYPKPF